MIRLPVRAMLGLTLLLGACAPVTAYNGFQARDDKPADMKVGVDTKSTVLTRLGSPSTVSAFDPNSWYYISQVTDRYAFYKPKVRTRDVVVISFGKDEQEARPRQRFADRLRQARDGHTRPPTFVARAGDRNDRTRRTAAAGQRPRESERSAALILRG